VLLTDGLWQRLFQADRNVLGRAKADDTRNSRRQPLASRKSSLLLKGLFLFNIAAMSATQKNGPRDSIMSMTPAELSRTDGVIFGATAREIITTLGSAPKRQSCDAWAPQSHASAAIDRERRRGHRTDHRTGLRTEPTPATADTARSCC
jgi:hypothetical protein